jgi:hypothetical protein
MSVDEPYWPCEAYGPELDRLEPEHAPHCFVGEPRLCGDQLECAVRMNTERWQLYARLVNAALQGDEDAQGIVAEIKYPWELLGGSGYATPPKDATSTEPAGGSHAPD